MEIKSFVLENTWLMGMDVGWGNGYIVIPKDHPWYMKDYDEIDVDVHCGLTFGRLIDKAEKDNPFYPYLGEYVIGFDTAHYQDNLQNCPKEYVEAETEKLKQQAIKAI